MNTIEPIFTKSLFAYASGITTPSAIVASEISRRITRGALRGIGYFSANLFGINRELVQKAQQSSGFINTMKLVTGLTTLLAIEMASGYASMRASNGAGQVYDPNYSLVGFGLKCFLACTAYNLAAYNIGLPQTRAGIPFQRQVPEQMAYAKPHPSQIAAG